MSEFLFGGVLFLVHYSGKCWYFYFRCNYLSRLGFLACSKTCLVWGTYSRRLQVVRQHEQAASTQRRLLQLMAHQPIANDCAGANGMAEGAGSAEPGLSTDQGSVGASVEQVAVPSAPPRPSARNKEAVRYHVEKGRRLPKPPKS